MIVWLVGYMGSGKSSIGRRVAKAAGFRFADTDREAEQLAGMSVEDIFRVHGQARFRELERQVLEGVARSEDDVVVATGGGMPCMGDNMELMNRTGFTVYLRSGIGRLVGRLGPGRERRPLIKGMDDDALAEYIRESMAVREPFYMSASAVVECDGACDDYIVRQVLNYINLSRPAARPQRDSNEPDPHPEVVE